MPSTKRSCDKCQMVEQLTKTIEHLSATIRAVQGNVAFLAAAPRNNGEALPPPDETQQPEPEGLRYSDPFADLAGKVVSKEEWLNRGLTLEEIENLDRESSSTISAA